MSSAHRVGIVFGKENAAAVLAFKDRKGRTKVLREVAVELDSDLWSATTPDLKPTMLKLARGLGRAARRADIPVAIGLPDTLITEEYVSFKEIPDTEAELQELVSWRVARDLRREPQDISVASQKLSQKEGETHVLARVLSAHLHDAIVDAAYFAGFTPTVLEGQSRYIDHMPGPAQDAADPSTLSARIVEVDGVLSALCHDTQSGTSNVQAQWLDDLSRLDAAQRTVRFVKSFSLTHDTQDVRIEIDASDLLADEIAKAMIKSGLCGDHEPIIRPDYALRDAALAVANIP